MPGPDTSGLSLFSHLQKVARIMDAHGAGFLERGTGQTIDGFDSRAQLNKPQWNQQVGSLFGFSKSEKRGDDPSKK